MRNFEAPLLRLPPSPSQQSMPVYLVFLQVAKKNLQLALCGPNLPASLEAGKLQYGTRHRRHFFELCFILSKLSVR